MSFQIYVEDAAVSFGTDTDGKKMSYNLWFSGCSKEPKCKNCHNPKLWKRNVECGESLETWMSNISDYSEFVEALVFLGGEPLDQPAAVEVLAEKARELGLETWLYTGKEYEEIPKSIVEIIDIIVSGPYVEEEATGEFPASSNQKITRSK